MNVCALKCKTINTSLFVERTRRVRVSSGETQNFSTMRIQRAVSSPKSFLYIFFLPFFFWSQLCWVSFNGSAPHRLLGESPGLKQQLVKWKIKLFLWGCEQTLKHSQKMELKTIRVFACVCMCIYINRNIYSPCAIFSQYSFSENLRVVLLISPQHLPQMSQKWKT